MKKRMKKILFSLIFAIFIVATCCFVGCKNSADNSSSGGGEDSHTWIKVDEVAPMCENEGTIEHFECSDCGKLAIFDGKEYTIIEKSRLVIPAGHSWGDEIQTIYATCENEGVKSHYECSVCHKFAVYENGGFAIKTGEELKIDKTVHDWGSIVEGTSATCVKNGVKSHYECSVCHKSAVKDGEDYVIKTADELVVAATGIHEWGDFIAEKAATCGENGLKAHYECSVCHKFAVKDGEDYVIKTADELVVAATGIHEWSDFIAEKAATCIETGIKEHYECSVCGEKSVKVGNEYVVKTNEELTIAMKNHIWGDEIPLKEATCDENGEKAHYECSVCHKKSIWNNGEFRSVSDNELVITAGHRWGKLTDGIAATCTGDGRHSYRQCEVCGMYAICDSVGNVIGYADDYDSLTVSRGHRFVYDTENRVYVCIDCNTAIDEREHTNINLNVHDDGGDYVCADEDLLLNAAEFGLKTITGISVDGVEVVEYTYTDGVLAIPYLAFAIGEGKYPYGEKKIIVVGNTGRDFEEAIEYPVLFKTKILKTEKDLEDFGKIALAQEDNSGKASDKDYSYGGYFELGADIDCNGKRYTMASAVSRQVSASVGGFKGVFDGKGYSIKNLLIGAEKVWYNGWDDTEDNVYKAYSFFGRLDGGKIKNVNFTGVKLNPTASVICSAGYGEISNIYAQIVRCAIIKDKNADGELTMSTPLGFSFSQGVSIPENTSLHEIIVDFSDCEYYALDKGVPVSAGSDIASYDPSYGFIDNPNIYNVFGKNVTKLENCFVIGYKGTALVGETIYANYSAMNITSEIAGKFDSSMFALRDGMLLPKKYVDAYDRLPNEFIISVTKNRVLKGDKIRVDLGDFEPFAEFVASTDKLTYSGGYVYADESLSGEVVFSFKTKNKNSNAVTLAVLTESEMIDYDVAGWLADGMEDLGSAVNSSEVAGQIGSQNIYKTVGGWGVVVANDKIDVSGYQELNFLYKTSVSVCLGSSDNENQNKADVWYYVKLVRNPDGSWAIYAKTADDEYGALEASDQYFSSSNATFAKMFKTWLWGSSGYDVYATNVYGVVYLPYKNVENLIELLPEEATTADEINQALKAYDSYVNLTDEQKSLVGAEYLTKLTAIVQKIFGDEISAFKSAGAVKSQDSALNGTSVKIDTLSDDGIYKISDLKGFGGRQIGVGININNYETLYFAMKLTAKVKIFDGDNTPALEANKWYSIKLVKGAEHWNVYAKAFGEDNYVEIVLSNYGKLASSGEVWFNTAFIVVDWTSADLSYDVYATGLWTKTEEAYKKVENLIELLPEDVSSAEEIKQTVNVYYAYDELDDEQKAKISSTAIEKLNSCFAQAFASELNFVKAGDVTKVSDSAMNGNSEKSGSYGAYDIYKMSDISGYGGKSIGYGCDMNNYSELYFAIKIPENVTIFSGTNTPNIAANKWHIVKLVKGAEHWEVFAKALGEENYTSIALDNYSNLGISGQVWFSGEFKTVRWTNEADVYDVYTTGLWAKQ